MKTRLTISAIGLVLVLASMTPLFAQPHQTATGVCCGGPRDCATGESCCDPVSMGRPDCDLDLVGFCQTTCTRVAGAS